MLKEELGQFLPLGACVPLSGERQCEGKAIGCNGEGRGEIRGSGKILTGASDMSTG